MATRQLDFLIKAITSDNNVYREAGSSNREKLAALWSMGDTLLRAGVTAPHAIGWQIQRATGDLVKRPTIFRSFKIRSIWNQKDKLLDELGGIKGLSNLTEMLPLIDPGQEVRSKLSPQELAEISRHACADDPARFKRFLEKYKAQYAHGRLGKALDKGRHLDNLKDLARTFRQFFKVVLSLLEEEDGVNRALFRKELNPNELLSLSNMCIALTTKDNHRLYKHLKPDVASSKNSSFAVLYARFRALLEKPADTERARLRRLMRAEELAGLSDAISSIKDEASVVDYRERKKASFSL